MSVRSWLGDLMSTLPPVRNSVAQLRRSDNLRANASRLSRTNRYPPSGRARRHASLENALRADPALGAVHQALDVGPVHVPEQGGQHQEQHRHRIIAEPPQRDRRHRARHQCRQRRVAGREGGCEPDDAEPDRRRPEQAEQHADIGGDALAALELQPDRKQVSEEGAERGDHGGLRAAQRQARDGDGDGALQHVADQGCGGEALAAGAQHIGRADIAGADGADVAGARDFRQDQAERDRAEQVADHKRRQQHQFRRHRRSLRSGRAIIRRRHSGASRSDEPGISNSQHAASSRFRIAAARLPE